MDDEEKLARLPAIEIPEWPDEDEDEPTTDHSYTSLELRLSAIAEESPAEAGKRWTKRK